MGGKEPRLGLHPTQDPHIAGAGEGGGHVGRAGFCGRKYDPAAAFARFFSITQSASPHYSLSVSSCTTTPLSGG